MQGPPAAKSTSLLLNERLAPGATDMPPILRCNLRASFSPTPSLGRWLRVGLFASRKCGCGLGHRVVNRTQSAIVCVWLWLSQQADYRLRHPKTCLQQMEVGCFGIVENVYTNRRGGCFAAATLQAATNSSSEAEIFTVAAERKPRSQSTNTAAHLNVTRSGTKRSHPDRSGVCSV